MYRPLFAPDGLPILRPNDFTPRGSLGMSRLQNLSFRPEDFMPKNETEQAAEYTAPIVGSAPNGLGFNFGDSFRRTGRGVMEFNMPTGQQSIINESLRWAAECVFVGKAMRLKTEFTCKGLRNSTADDQTNLYLDSVLRKLNMHRMYRLGVWLYYTVGIVPFLLNEPEDPLSFIQIIDPRQIRVHEWYGKQHAYLLPDARMLAAINDPKGTDSPFNKDYWESMPKSWRAQILKQANEAGGDRAALMIKLTEGSYSIIQNRATNIERTADCWDGAPLQPYFGACQQYRQLMAGDFAAAFLAKNLIALVSVGDPKAEGLNYQRADSTTLASMQAALQNPNYAQWLYADPTFNIRYITPDVDTFGSSKYDEVRAQLQELLPNCFWSGEDGSFANSQTSLMALQDEVDACNDAFDQNFFRPIYERAAERNPRVAKRAAKPPLHDKNALRDKFAWLTSMSELYSNGGLDIRTLVEAHGFDWDAVRTRLQDQKADIKKGIFVPAFESKQGIVAGILEKAGVLPQDSQVIKVPTSKGLPPTGGGSSSPSAPSASAKTPASKSKRPRGGRRARNARKAAAGKPGAPKKAGSRPQPEANNSRAPRPNTSGKG